MERRKNQIPEQKKPVIVMTGGTKGIGKAIVKALLEKGANVEIISLARTKFDLQDNRLHQIQLDLAKMKSANVQKTIQDLLGQIQGRVTGVVYSAGMATLDNGSDEELAQMDQVNTDGAVELAKIIERIEGEVNGALFMYVSSLAAENEAAPQVPGLRGYGASKRRAIEALSDQRVWSGKLTVLEPGVFWTEMAEGVMQDDTENGLVSPFEFFAAPMADAVANNPMMQYVQRAMMKGEYDERKRFPRFSAWYMKMIGKDRQKKLLPYLIRIFGKSVLNQVNQGAKEHNARVKWHKEQSSYGEGFPYDDIMYDKLWSASFGEILGRLMKFLRLC